MKLTSTELAADMSPRFGNANPERMDCPLWQLMIENEEAAHWARNQFGWNDVSVGPIWCFNRFGQTRTVMPDGREIYIGGEHEDFYDEDFFIYNDVIVRHPDGQVEIFGYPADAFAPTDGHSATLVGNLIYVIGAIGYQEAREVLQKEKPNLTSVYQLDCTTYEMVWTDTTGDAPGWISDHDAVYDSATNSITVLGGKVMTLDDYQHNTGIFRLNLVTLEWSRVGNRSVPPKVLADEKLLNEFDEHIAAIPPDQLTATDVVNAMLDQLYVNEPETLAQSKAHFAEAFATYETGQLLPESL